MTLFLFALAEGAHRLLHWLADYTNSAMQGLVADLCQLRAVLQHHALAQVRHPDRVGAVARLRARSRPHAVSWPVPFVYAQAFDGRARGARPHVPQKRTGVSSPLRTHRDPSGPILSVFRVVGVHAATLRVVVGLEFGGLFPPRRMTVGHGAGGQELGGEAPTTLRRSATQGVQEHRGLPTAGTAAHPTGMSPGRRVAKEGYQPPEGLAGNVECFHSRTLPQ